MGTIGDAFKAAWRDFVTDGIPATGENDPDKAEIRPIGNLIDQLVNGIAAGIQIVATTAARDAFYATAENQSKLVYVNNNNGSDTDPANGVYEYVSGAARLAQGFYAGVASVVQPLVDEAEGYKEQTEAIAAQFTGTNGAAAVTYGSINVKQMLDLSVMTFDATYSEALRDFTNVLGGGVNALYLPRTLYFKRSNGTQYNITVANSAATEISGGAYCKIQLPSANVAYVYFDTVDQTYKIESYASALDLHPERNGEIIKLFDVRGKALSGRMPFREIDDMPGRSDIVFTEDLILEAGGKLLVPSFYVRGSGAASWTLRNPAANGERYFEIDGADSGHVAHIFNDGFASTGFVKRAYDGAAGSQSGFNRSTIATISNRKVSSPHSMAGNVPGGAVANQCPFGKASIDAMPRNFAPTNIAATTITDANLTALGFTRGFTRLTGAGDIFVGMDLPDARRGGSIFIREYIYTDVAGSFGIPRAYLWSATATSPITTFNLTLEKKISDNVAVYSGIFDFPDVEGALYLYMGTTVTAGTTPIVTGFQFHHSGARARWIMRDDYPSALVDADLLPIIGKDLFVVSDRNTIIYPRQMLGDRTDNVADWFLESRQGAPIQPLQIGPSQGQPMVIDHARVGSAAYLRMYPRNRRDRMFQKVLTVNKKTVPVSGSPAPKILMIGDSLTNRQMAYFINLYLTAMGFAPVFVGTMNGNGAGNAAGTGPLGEGREGWALTDFFLTRQDADVTSVVAAGGEAAYLALSNAAKLAANPFMQIAASSSSAAPTITYGGTDYKFDLAYYLSRFSLATPDIVVLNLSKNDQLEQNAATALSDVTTLYPAMLAEIRRAMPSAKILCWGTTMPDSYASNAEWIAKGAPILRAIRDAIEAKRVAGDNNIKFVPTHAMHSISDFNTPTTTDTASGTQIGTVGATNTDIIHSPVPTTITSGVGREQIAEALAVAIACEA
ncbi:SGNH/GDSL hydrolase family protein [Novosphingobium sp. KA1]|uniref:SGNH/GDSL hydrolase family protein n=1 Tax=Novosphingobium sp. (strain KA1) TaxID=164608 RepID=UPI001A8FE601|nr:SGNH/GDSL hydrolase family protein [Novosphingobium sp. KA1]QSR18398.1 hypothetical protein CA833_14580 [Novosphingobium sp. KA1]